jgi:NitT/TauT family transport system substrate-binding protein
MPHSRSRFLGLLAAELASSAPRLARAQAENSIRLGTVAGDGYAEPYYAADEGFFARAGLDVDVQTFTSGAGITQAVTSGALDVGITNPISLANAVEHGLPLVFFAAAALYNPLTVGFCVAADSPIKTAKDLDGQTIGTTALRDSNSLHVMAWVDQHGGDSSTLRLIELPFSAMAAAISRGTVAAAPIAEPLLSAGVRAGTLRVLAHTMDVYGRNFMVGGYIAQRDWLAKNLALTRRFTEAIYATARWANAHQDESGKILTKYTKLELATVQGMARSPYADALTPAMFQSYLDLGYKYKYLDRHFNASQLMVKV